MGRDAQYPRDLTPQITQNAESLVQRVATLLERAAAENISPVKDTHTGTFVASGWRPKTVNDRTSNASKTSLHLSGQGVDLRDGADRQLARWCLRNLEVLAELQLWMEDPRWTPNWVHLQAGPPPNQKRVFVPSLAPPMVAALPEQAGVA
jgi:hypothetical protein